VKALVHDTHFNVRAAAAGMLVDLVGLEALPAEQHQLFRWAGVLFVSAQR